MLDILGAKVLHAAFILTTYVMDMTTVEMVLMKRTVDQFTLHVVDFTVTVGHDVYQIMMCVMVTNIVLMDQMKQIV